MEESPPTPESTFRRLGGAFTRHREPVLYLVSVAAIVVSYLLWFNFNSPPINSNTGFDLYPWTAVGLSDSQVNPFAWSGPYVSTVFGVPSQLYFGALLTLSESNYGVAYFLSFAIVDSLGAVCLCYMLMKWLGRFGVRQEYALIGVLIYTFNEYRLLSGFGTTDGYASLGPFAFGSPAVLVILLFLSYLTLFRSLAYALVLGIASFFAFADFPLSTLIVTVEYLAVLAGLLALRWQTLTGLRSRERLVQFAKGTGAVLGSVVAANAYLVYPLIALGSSFTLGLQTANPFSGRSYAFDSTETFSNSIRLITNWAVFTDRSPPWAAQFLTEPAVILLSFVVPVLAFAALLYLRYPGELLLYSVMLAVAWLSTSTNSPTGQLFVLFTTSVGPLQAFYNGETFSPLLLLLYCAFAPLTVARLSGWSTKWHSSAAPQQGEGTSARRHPLRRLQTPVLARAWRIFWPTAIVAVLLLSSYPALSAQYTRAAAPSYPIDVSLPPYYLQANHALQSTNPNGPVMVFPQVQTFDSNAVNGTVWYYGIDSYPSLLSNPSISSSYPYDYHGEDGNDLPVPGLVYDLGGATCTTIECIDGGMSPLPLTSNLWVNQSIDFSTSNASVINWQAYLASDSLSFLESNASVQLAFQVNQSVVQPNGHWLLGYLPHAENLSGFSYAVINYTLQGASPNSIQFGFHSYSEYGPGSGYYIGNFTLLQAGTSQTVLLPLDQPSVTVDGNLDNVTNLFFVDDSHATTGVANLTVRSIRFIRPGALFAPTWTTTTPGDNVSLTARAEGTTLQLSVDDSVLDSNGHWALGLFGQPTDLSEYDYAVVTYSLRNANPDYLLFGFHSGTDYGLGDGYALTDYLTVQNGSTYTTYIPLQAPSIIDGGSMSNVTDFFFVYTPPGTQSGVSYVNVSSIRVTDSDPDRGLALADGLERLGVEFAYVDASIVPTTYPFYTATYYNDLLSGSPYFAQIFQSGSVTIYKDLLFTGPFVSPLHVEMLDSTTATVGTLSVPFATVYFNASNIGMSYVPASVIPSGQNFTQANISNIREVSPSVYTLTVSETRTGILDFLAEYDSRWTAVLSTGAHLSRHFEVDGFSNGWELPAGSYRVTISFSGSQTFLDIELATLSVPALFAVGFVAVFLIAPRRPRIQRVTDGRPLMAEPQPHERD